MRSAGGPVSRVGGRIRGRGEHDGDAGGRGRTPGRNVALTATRGAVLIGVAVIIGIVLLQVDRRRRRRGRRRRHRDGGGTPTTTATPDGSSTTTTTTVSPNGARPPSQVVVQVLNGSGVQGAANAERTAI